MRPGCAGHPIDRLRRLAAAALLALGAVVAGCGGGASSGTPAAPAADPAVQPYDDPQAYSSAPDAALPGAVEAAAVSRHRVAVGGATIDVTARAGHLIARAPGSGAAQASIFHVAYTADVLRPSLRPVTFFYNGGPGSATVWLHLGSFGPRRVATGVPSTTLPRPFPVVANAETLLDTTDLVFVDAVGSGHSQAIAPYTNRSFWGVDADAALFRDAVVRWLAAHGREDSPVFLYGESYGGVRSGVLARLLEESGVRLTGVVLQAPAMDYHSNCGVTGQPAISCAGYLATYGAIGAWHQLVTPPASDADAYAAQMRSFATGVYAPAVQAWFAGVPPDATLPPRLEAATGLAAHLWTGQLNLPPHVYAANVLPGRAVGRYDARITAPIGTPLAAGGDPSSTLINASFAAAVRTELRDRLGYRNASTYVLLSQAIQHWSFDHAGRPLPDAVPDLAEAMRLNPRLRVMAVSGYHDLATPFHLTELDLARLPDASRVRVHNYPGGHMSYLDDTTRVRQKADLVAFYRDALAAAAPRDGRKSALGGRGRWPAVAGADRTGRVPSAPQAPVPQEAFQVPRLEPWVPPERRPR